MRAGLLPALGAEIQSTSVVGKGERSPSPSSAAAMAARGREDPTWLLVVGGRVWPVAEWCYGSWQTSWTKKPLPYRGRGHQLVGLFLICRDHLIPLDLAPFPRGMVAATSKGQSLSRSR